MSFVKVKWGMGNIYIFLLEGNFLNLFGYVRIERHLPLINHIDIFSRSLFILSADTLVSLTKEKIDISANNLAADETSLARSLMYIKKNKGPNIKPCGTPARIGVHVEVWLFSTTLWSLLFRKL